jgi:hypothetical protein
MLSARVLSRRDRESHQWKKIVIAVYWILQEVIKIHNTNARLAIEPPQHMHIIINKITGGTNFNNANHY